MAKLVVWSRPNSAILDALVEMATKWRSKDSAVPPFSRYQARAVRALARVSAVVKVLEVTTNSVRAGSRSRSEEHTSELQSLMRISYAVFCLKIKTQTSSHTYTKLMTIPLQNSQQHM